MRWLVPHCGIRKEMVYLSACVLCFLWQLLMGITLTYQLTRPPMLLVVSFDGFRWDYLDMVRRAGRQTPVFDSLIDNGVKAKWVKNSYVTLTFPNHYTIATGLYEENHGIVSNQMYDPVFDETFDSTPQQLSETRWWNNDTNSWKGEPIWLTNQRRSDHHSGVYFWTGSEAAIRGQHAKYYMHYNKSVPYTKRIDTVVSWFLEKQQPINLGMLYFEDPDLIGHQAGPDSLEIIERIIELDEILGYIINSLKEIGLFADMNLIVTSDHGMAELIDTVYLEDYVDSRFVYSAYGRPPVLHILPQDENQLDDLYTSLQDTPHVHVYKKADIPLEYHYRYNRRILPLIVEAHHGYLVCKDRKSCTWQATQKGDHGYNNSLSDMHPIFIAHGPAFNRGQVTEPFNNVDIYSLMCHILDVDPASHDGSFDNIKHVLQDGGVKTLSKMVSDHSQNSLTAIGAVLGVLFLVCGIFCLVKFGLPPPSKWTLTGGYRHSGHSENQNLLAEYTQQDV